MFEQAVIAEYQQRLQNGEDFILLAKESMKKVGEDSTHYYMGWIGWKDMGIGPEDTAYSLEPGQISTPVSSRNGWHIFLLLNKEERFYADQSTFENERQSLTEAIYARRVEERSHSWVDSLRMQYPFGAPYVKSSILRRMVKATKPTIISLPNTRKSSSRNSR